jgi:hypothetical protein
VCLYPREIHCIFFMEQLHTQCIIVSHNITSCYVLWCQTTATDHFPAAHCCRRDMILPPRPLVDEMCKMKTELSSFSR